jgi:hypothetical protein
MSAQHGHADEAWKKEQAGKERPAKTNTPSGRAKREGYDIG